MHPDRELPDILVNNQNTLNLLWCSLKVKLQWNRSYCYTYANIVRKIYTNILINYKWSNGEIFQQLLFCHFLKSSLGIPFLWPYHPQGSSGNSDLFDQIKNFWYGFRMMEKIWTFVFDFLKMFLKSIHSDSNQQKNNTVQLAYVAMVAC